MPYIDPTLDPWNPYNYVTKEGKPRLPPVYYQHGYKLYQDNMNAWMDELKKENDDYWANQSKFNKRELWKPYNYTFYDRIPVYHTYPEFLKKAKKYALIKRKIYLNKQKALAKRKARYK